MINLIPIGDAQVSSFGEDEDETCEGCFCRRAVGTFNLGGVETPLCGGCTSERTSDGNEVVLYNGM
ncbi:hypothetical protein [Streptomyces sp. WG5]|uniref:hypothetical protein n=1 Tax=Streptomyces sp. WG5 TaxID=3417648 RepID=UPI003CEA60C4